MNESYIWMSHVTHMNESCLRCEWFMSHRWMSHTWTIRVWTWLIHMYDMTCCSVLQCAAACYSLLQFVTVCCSVLRSGCVTWTIHVWTWLIHMYDMTHSYVWHDSFMCVTRLIVIRREQFTRVCDVTWLIHLCDVTWLIHVCVLRLDVTHAWVCDMTQSYV